MSTEPYSPSWTPRTAAMSRRRSKQDNKPLLDLDRFMDERESKEDLIDMMITPDNKKSKLRKSLAKKSKDGTTKTPKKGKKKKTSKKNKDGGSVDNDNESTASLSSLELNDSYEGLKPPVSSPHTPSSLTRKSATGTSPHTPATRKGAARVPSKASGHKTPMSAKPKRRNSADSNDSFDFTKLGKLIDDDLDDIVMQMSANGSFSSLPGPPDSNDEDGGGGEIKKKKKGRRRPTAAATATGSSTKIKAKSDVATMMNRSYGAAVTANTSASDDEAVLGSSMPDFSAYTGDEKPKKLKKGRKRPTGTAAAGTKAATSKVKAKSDMAAIMTNRNMNKSLDLSKTPGGPTSVSLSDDDDNDMMKTGNSSSGSLGILASKKRAGRRPIRSVVDKAKERQNRIAMLKKSRENATSIEEEEIKALYENVPKDKLALIDRLLENDTNQTLSIKEKVTLELELNKDEHARRLFSEIRYKGDRKKFLNKVRQAEIDDLNTIKKNLKKEEQRVQDERDEKQRKKDEEIRQQLQREEMKRQFRQNQSKEILTGLSEFKTAVDQAAIAVIQKSNEKDKDIDPHAYEFTELEKEIINKEENDVLRNLKEARIAQGATRGEYSF